MRREVYFSDMARLCIFPLEEPWSSLLDVISCFASGYIGARIERARIRQYQLRKWYALK
jgi:hypothetical protein